tara:strand:- start:3392 stop:3970 length:579 start_codon:yes stop_codon:yes gene_type:complete
MKKNKSFFIHQTSILDKSSKVGKGTKIWHFCNIMNDSVIGNNCILGQNVFIGSGVIIGNNVKIQNNVSVYKGVICEDDVFIGPSSVFTNVINPRSAIDKKNEFKTTILKKGCTIGANATIICGNTIGNFSLVGAGSVVTKDINNYEVVVGNPAKKIGWASEQGISLIFKKNKAICSISKEIYILKKNKVYKA